MAFVNASQIHTNYSTQYTNAPPTGEWLEQGACFDAAGQLWAVPGLGFHCPTGYSPINYGTSKGYYGAGQSPYGLDSLYSGSAVLCSLNGPDLGKNLSSTNTNICPQIIGDPINAGTGDKFQVETDYSAAGTTLTLSRSYHSMSLNAAWNSGYTPGTSQFGSNWSSSYERSLSVSVSGTLTTATLNRPDGGVLYFNLVNGSYVADEDITDTLTQLTDSSGNTTGWRYAVSADDSIETYDASGKLLTIADRAGRIQTLAYDAQARLVSVTDDTGRQLVFSYDALNRIASVATPGSGIYTYTYDTSNNLSYVTYPDGHQRIYSYNEQTNTTNTNLPHALTGITDENGDRYSTTQYDTSGRAILTEEGPSLPPPAGTFNLAYTTGANGSPVYTVVTDPLTTQRTYNFTTVLGVVKSTGVSQPGGSGCSAASSAITYDPNGNVASRADFNGHKTCYAYDLTRNLETARVEGLASSSSCPSNLATYTPAPNSAERKILTQWDTRFRLPTKLTEAGRETTTVYDSHGNVTSRSIKDLASGQTRTWSTVYAYHPTVPGVLMQKIDNGPRLDVADMTTTDYYAPDENCVGDPLGCRGQVKQITNALGHVTTYNEYDANGRVLRTTDPNGLVTTFSYSPRGWLLSRSDGSETTSIAYHYLGQLIKFTRPDGSYVNFEYDPAHRLTAIVQQDGGRLTYTLDAMGNRIHEEITRPDNTYVYYAHSRTFDALGRLWQDIGAYNQTVTYQYDAQGNMKQVDGARSDVADVTQHGYDALDRLIQTLNADGGVVQVKPNALDQTTQVVDPVNQATTQTVDAFGDVTRTVSADTGTTNRTYDEAGNLKSETDARGVTVSYTYDALNRLTKKQSSDPNTPVYTYIYDQTRLGRLNFIQRNGNFNMFFNYDAQGRLYYQLSAVAGTGWLYSLYTYDPYGRLSQITYPSDRSVSYSYDDQGRISQVSTQPQSGTPVTVLANTFVYNYPFAGPQWFTYGDGTWSYQSRDQDYRPWVRLDGSYLKYYIYDAAGDVAALNDINNTVLTYAYDATGRLVSALDSASNGFGSLAWTYDKNGNRQSETRNAGTMPYAYSPPNWLYQKGAETRPRTANGNTLSTSTASFAYDGYNRLVTSQTASETTTYTYNALGQRIKKINQNGLATSFHYGPDGELLYEQDQAGNTKVYVWLDGRPLARIDNDAHIYYYHVDHLGTPWAMTDATGTVVWKSYYEPFGSATVRPVSTIENNLRLPGQYYDRETGMHYNYLRDYDPTTGRYIEVDPIGIAGGLNTYGYVGGNPLIGIDPYGLFDITNPADWPALPQGLVDYFEGYGSYYGGLFNAGKHMYMRAGFSGDCNKQRAIEDEAILAAGLVALSQPQIAKEVYPSVKRWAGNHKAYLGGRLSAGALTSAITGVGPYGGLSLGLLAGMGDALNNIDRGADHPDDVLRSILGDKIPNLPIVYRTQCGCQ